MGNGKSLNMARCSPSISSPTTNKIIVQLKQKLKFNNSCGHSCPFYYRGMECKSRMKRCPFHYRGLECKSRKSRNTWSNRQIWPWNMKGSRAKANRVLPTECTSHSKNPLPTTQEKILHMDNPRWPTLKSDWLYSLQPKMEKLYTVSKKNRSWLWPRAWTPYCQIQT